MPETSAETVLTDADGRKITVRLLKPSEQFKLTKIVGKQGGNSAYIGMAMIAASVREIGETPVPMPTQEVHIEQIFDKLGDAGWAVVQNHFAPPDEEAPANDAMESAKN